MDSSAATANRRDKDREQRDRTRERERGGDRDGHTDKKHDRDAYRRSSRDSERSDRKKSSSSKKDKRKKDRKSSSKKLKYKDSSSSRHRHRHRSPSSDSDPEGSSDEDDGDQEFSWVEKTSAAVATGSEAHAQPTEPPAQLTRDSWMTGGGDNDTLGGLFGGLRDDRKSTARAAAEEKKRNAPHGDIHISSREINPYWKMGLKGLPPLSSSSGAASSGDGDNDSDSSVSSSVSHFAMRKMDRVLEIAKEENRTVEEVGVERFGSTEAFQEAYAVYQSSRKPLRPSGSSSLRIASSANDTHGAGPSTGGPQSAAPPTATPSSDGDMTLDEMVRRERLGIDDNMDRALMQRISRDARFKDDVDYMDEESDRLASTASSKHKRKQQLGMGAAAGGRRKITSMEDLVRQHKALKECQYCFRDGGRLPDLPTIVAVGIRAYLVIVPYRSVATCQIIPVDHLVSTLEGDDEFWDEVRNFQKCLMQMYATQNLAVLFSETVLDPTHARHTCIDVIPVPPHVAADAPGYVRTALRTDAEAHEWTQHQAVIDTRVRTNTQGQRVGGFRRCMVPNLPYVHVWYDLDGGHGHVIEERGSKMHDGFVREVLGGAMDVDPTLYRKQRWLPRQVNHDRVREFVQRWEPFDWTKMLDGGEYEDPATKPA